MKQKILSLIVLILSLTIYAAAAQDLEVINFKFGIISITPKDGFIVSKETAVIPNKEGVMYGFTYDFVKRRNTPIRETITLQLPSANNENTAVVSDSLIEDPSGTWYFGLKIDKGDPSGKFAIIIQHDNVVFKRIEYVVE